MPILTSNERLGTEIAGKYRLDRILGRGGMGVVFAGVHRWTDRRVAVKLLNPEHVQNRDTVRRFLREAKAATKLEHRNVVDVLDMGRDEDETVYLVLELLEGYSLAELLAARGALPPSLALDVLRPMMDALALAHEHGIVHRDLKPDNIYVSRDGDGMMVPKLLDFGIAKIAETEGSAATHTGALVGTPRYMSPEQVDASVDVGPAADIWSIGVVLFECLAGRPPFEQPTAPSLFVAIMSTEPPALNEVAPDVPAAIAACVDRALSRAPSDRWPSMRAFLVALDAAALEAGVTTQDRRPLPAIAAAEDSGEELGFAPTTPADPEASTGDEALAEPAPTPVAQARSPMVAVGVALVAVLAVGAVLFFGDGEPTTPTAPAAGGGPAPIATPVHAEPPPTETPLTPHAPEVEAMAPVEEAPSEPAASPDPEPESTPRRRPVRETRARSDAPPDVAEPPAEEVATPLTRQW